MKKYHNEQNLEDTVKEDGFLKKAGQFLVRKVAIPATIAGTYVAGMLFGINPAYSGGLLEGAANDNADKSTSDKTAVEPKKVEPKKVEPKKVEPKKVEPKKVEPKKVEPKKVEHDLSEAEKKDYNRKCVENGKKIFEHDKKELDKELDKELKLQELELLELKEEQTELIEDIRDLVDRKYIEKLYGKSKNWSKASELEDEKLKDWFVDCLNKDPESLKKVLGTLEKRAKKFYDSRSFIYATAGVFKDRNTSNNDVNEEEYIPGDKYFRVFYMGGLNLNFDDNLELRGSFKHIKPGANVTRETEYSGGLTIAFTPGDLKLALLYDFTYDDLFNPDAESSAHGRLSYVNKLAKHKFGSEVVYRNAAETFEVSLKGAMEKVSAENEADTTNTTDYSLEAMVKGFIELGEESGLKLCARASYKELNSQENYFSDKESLTIWEGEVSADYFYSTTGGIELGIKYTNVKDLEESLRLNLGVHQRLSQGSPFEVRFDFFYEAFKDKDISWDDVQGKNILLDNSEIGAALTFKILLGGGSREFGNNHNMPSGQKGSNKTSSGNYGGGSTYSPYSQSQNKVNPKNLKERSPYDKRSERPFRNRDYC